MNKFIPVHEVTYERWYHSENGMNESHNTRQVSKNLTYVNVDLIQQIYKTGEHDTSLYFGQQEKITIDGAPEDIIKLIYA